MTHFQKVMARLNFWIYDMVIDYSEGGDEENKNVVRLRIHKIMNK